MSALSLVLSPHQHLEQMSGHRPGLCDRSAQAHTMALKSLAFFLVFCTSYFLTLIIGAVKITTFQNHWHGAWEVVTYARICLHSSILVISSPEDQALESPGQRAVHLKLSVSIPAVNGQAHE